MDDLAKLKRGLKTEMELALAGEARRSVVLLLREDRLPLACVTDARGVVTKKVVSYVDLLAALDGSSVVEALKREATRTTRLPPLPRNTMFVDLVEKPSGNALVLTGWIEPREHLFVLESGGETTTHEIALPPCSGGPSGTRRSASSPPSPSRSSRPTWAGTRRARRRRCIGGLSPTSTRASAERWKGCAGRRCDR